jgi:NAD(P)-dependent dehydrogenase (short-subunit alcohol dehydrogenase family)
MESLEGKVVIVTGGARGLGEAISCVLGEAGMVVIPADIRIDLAREVAQSIQNNGHRSMPVELDVSDEKSVKQAIQQVLDQFGRIDVLINNAGTDKTESVEEISVQDWDRVLAVNLRGPFLMAKYVFAAMREVGGGQIVNITSTAAKRAWANASAYHASKWGLLGLSHALHVEGRPHHIKVTALVSGGMRTPFLLDRFPDIDVDNLQDPRNVAETVRYVLTMPPETVIPEIMVLPMRETSWP